MTIFKTFRGFLGRRCLPRMDSGWGGDGAREGMWAREKMCPGGWKRRRGWGEGIPQGGDVFSKIWNQGEDDP
jgi:hypothetical protein